MLTPQTSTTDLATSSRTKWRLSPSGGIETDLETLSIGEVHCDHIEMGGRAVNAIIKWSVGPQRRFGLERCVRWPSVRRAQDDTHASFSHTFQSLDDPEVLVDGIPYSPAPAHTIAINGFLRWQEVDGPIEVTRTLFPSTSLPCIMERWEIRNVGQEEHRIQAPTEPCDVPQPRELFVWSAHIVRTEWIGGGVRVLAPGETMTCGMVFSCREAAAPAIYPSIESEMTGRIAYRDALYGNLDLVTPDASLNQLFRFSKLHAAENVVATRGGLMHAPGGFNTYLAALWCNDQNEYASPFFPFLGDEGGNQSAVNAYRWFSRYQNDEFRPIPSSIIAEGRGTWEGAGDRGDAAMTAYGAARWALATGDVEQARLMWPFIKWCVEYCMRQKNDYGVIQSDSDELENRFSAGRTNLATSCLTYDALLSASNLATALAELPEVARSYTESAAELRAAIEDQFGANISGYETYRYHEDLDRLRAWICFPLTVGIYDRARGTVAALFNSDLWTSDGLLTETGTTTRWDRSTLYALRGAFAAGFANDALSRLSVYSGRRLLGEHVPYCVEAFPEGNQSQLSAESALYCRIFTEGVFGIRPIGFDCFECTPSLPTEWPQISLHNINAFARKWSLNISWNDGSIEVAASLANGHEFYRAKLAPGKTHTIHFPKT